MTKHLKYLIAALVLLLAPQFVSAQQNTLTQTTLSAAVTGAILGQGSPAGQLYPAPTVVQVASATNIIGLSPNLGTTPSQPTNPTALYIDRELMQVIAVNGLAITVVRGAGGTSAAPHSSGAMVLVGKMYWFYPNDPGGSESSGFGVSHATCVLNNVVVTPWVNIRTGAQWACSPATLTWEPWFNNVMNPSYSSDFGTAAAATGAQTILGPLFRLSGTNAITSFTIPVGLNATAVGSGQFCIVPTGAFTATATNNISAASTAVAGKTLCYTWDPATAKFNPSY